MGPITVTLLVVLGALLFMILKKLFERPAAPNPSSNAPRAAPKQDLGSLTVADARVGDNISIPGAGAISAKIRPHGPSSQSMITATAPACLRPPTQDLPIPFGPACRDGRPDG